VAVQPDGSIVAAGQWQGGPGDPSYLFVKRYSAGGVPLQESFVLSQARGFGITVQPDGKVIAAGAQIFGPLPHPLLLERHRLDIALDPTFDGDGLVITNTGNGHDEGRAVLVQADGKIVVAGLTWPTGPTTQAHFGVLRYEGGLVCGNTVLEAGEQCDDGNNVDGDCCTFGCAYEAGGSACPGGTCDGAGGCVPTTTTTTLPPRSRCATAKFRAAGRKTTSKTACHATAVMKAASPDPACLSKAEAKFSSSFAKADAQGFGCLTTGDAAAIEAKIDTLVADLVNDLGSGGPSKCTSSKYKNAGKKVSNKFACQALALTKGAVVDGACLAKAESKFSSGFAKAETGPDCLTTGDTAAIEADIDALVGDVTNDLVP
jgi:cysteine-rich repeat protein